MELNHPLWSSADYRQYHHQDIVRSFKCSFCKRGFSNAQALGGHMNIHRKDRAKLRQLSYNNNEDDDDDDDDATAAEHNISNYRRIRRLKRSHNKGVENHQQQQIPLFMEATQWVGLGCDQIMHSSCITRHNGHESYDEDLLPELDLELRLGPEPDHRAMAACLGTRNFF